MHNDHNWAQSKTRVYVHQVYLVFHCCTRFEESQPTHTSIETLDRFKQILRSLSGEHKASNSPPMP